MTEQDPNAQAVDTAATLFGIPLQPPWRDAAITNFATLTAAAALVTSFPLDDEADYAPVFTP